jgi:hypothetical protein
MNEFIAKQANQIAGVLSGFDRLVFRGNLRALCGQPGMEQYLRSNHVRLLDFGRHVEQTCQRIKAASLRAAEQRQRPVKYLSSAAISKEDTARQIAESDHIKKGLICVLKTVEPCTSFELYRNPVTHRLEVQPRLRRCLHLYHYWLHPSFGFMSARLQTWFPFRIQVCLNGREWLARQLDAERIAYLRADNCFPWVQDYAAAQRLLSAQLRTRWPQVLRAVARALNPDHEPMFRHFQVDYYWSTYQSEWATDLSFREGARLRERYPALVRQALCSFGSAEVMRFLGRTPTLAGKAPKNFVGELMSDLQHRPEGVRLKHRLNGNSVKIYDKAGCVLRVETTIHNSDDLRVYRPSDDHPNGPPAWRPMRRSVADLYRRAQISEQANQRYLTALATLGETTPLGQLVQRLESPIRFAGKRVRALRLFDRDDRRLLELINRGEFCINGLRNRDLRQLFFGPDPSDPLQARRRSAQVSRRLRLLRAHGLLRKVPHTHRYQLTDWGRRTITAILNAQAASVEHLATMAA